MTVSNLEKSCQEVFTDMSWNYETNPATPVSLYKQCHAGGNCGVWDPTSHACEH